MCVRLSVNQSAMLTPYYMPCDFLYYIIDHWFLKLFSIATQIVLIALCMSETEH